MTSRWLCRAASTEVCHARRDTSAHPPPRLADRCLPRGLFGDVWRALCYTLLTQSAPKRTALSLALPPPPVPRFDAMPIWFGP